MGSIGCSSGFYLYFEIYIKGNGVVNLMVYLFFGMVYN